MSSNEIAVGELLYEAAINLTKVTEYGVSFEALAGGQTAPPPEGARFDVAVEGNLQGSKLNGRITGVDYIHVRADGRFQLHIHGEVTTEDEAKIALFAEGISTPGEEPGIFNLRENGTLTTSYPDYSWVNQLQLWAQGTVNLATGKINLKVYAA